MATHEGADDIEMGQRGKDLRTHHRVAFHLLELGGSERTLLGKEAFRDRNHSDVMEQGGLADLFYLFVGPTGFRGDRRGQLGYSERVPREPRVSGFDHRNQCFQGRDRKILHLGALPCELRSEVHHLLL